jgi:hypothetical protein
MNTRHNIPHNTNLGTTPRILRYTYYHTKRFMNVMNKDIFYTIGTVLGLVLFPIAIPVAFTLWFAKRCYSEYFARCFSKSHKTNKIHLSRISQDIIDRGNWTKLKDGIHNIRDGVVDNINNTIIK